MSRTAQPTSRVETVRVRRMVLCEEHEGKRIKWKRIKWRRMKEKRMKKTRMKNIGTHTWVK